MEINKSLNIKEAIICVLDASIQEGYSVIETAKILQGFLDDVISGKEGFVHNKSRDKPDNN